MAFPPILSQISVEICQQRCARKGEALKTHPVGLLAPWVYDEKLPVGTQFLFGTFMFIVREDGNLELEVWGLPPRQWVPIYGGASRDPTNPSSTTTSASDDICSGLNPYVGLYVLATMTLQRYLIGVPIFHPSAGTSSSTSSGASTNRDSIKDYLEIVSSIYWNPVVEARCITMVGLSRAPSHNSSTRYPTIRGSKASDARTPSNRVVRNLNSDFNDVQLQTIMESIQCLVPQVLLVFSALAINRIYKITCF
jgi:hypothetical protein